MIPHMTDEQFALFIADNGRRSPEVTIQAAEQYLKWLESKKPKVASVKYYRDGVEIPNPLVDHLG